MNYIEIENVNLNFKNQVIFKDANLSVSNPGLYCLVGRNGTGKTTLFNILTKKVKVDSGNILIENEDNISYCEANSLLFSNLTVKENLLLITDNLDKIIDLLEKFHISKLIDASPKRLSEGEKQRVAIIRTVLEDKPIMLLDEVTSHIDDEITDIVLQYLSELSKTHIIIYATHYKKEVNLYADYIIRVEDKKIDLETKRNNDNNIAECKKIKYIPTKILNKIIRFIPDYFFSFIFIILTSISLLSIWLFSLTPNDVFLRVESKSLNSKYSVIDDYSMNIFDGSNKESNSGTNVDEVDEIFIKLNSSFKLGIKNYDFRLGMDTTHGVMYTCYVQYFMFDNDLVDYDILCNQSTYEMLKEYNLVSNNVFKFRNVEANISVLEGNYYFNFFVANEYTFKQIDKFNTDYVNTTEETQVHLISGRLPVSDNEMVVYSGLNEPIGSTFTSIYGDVKKEFTIVGIFDYVENSIYEVMPNYIVLNNAFDFILEGDALKNRTQGYIAYGDTLDLTDSDVNYILKNHLYVINDLIGESYYAYRNFKNLRGDFIRILIFVLLFDVLVISFYIAYWFNSNKDRYLELKILNRIDLIKKRCIISRFFLNCLIFLLGIINFIILQNVINDYLIKDCFNSTSIDLYQLTFIQNKFLLYTIPLLLILQSIIVTTQLRRSLYD